MSIQRLSVLLTTTFVFLGINSYASNKVDSQISKAKSGSSYDVLIILKDQAELRNVKPYMTKDTRGRIVYQSLTTLASATQEPLVQLIKSKKVEYRQYYIINMIHIPRANMALIEELSRRDEVKSIIPNTKVRLKYFKTGGGSSSSGIEGGIESTGAPKAWAKGINGAGIVVAGQDTGYQWDHPALINKYRGNANGKVEHDYNWHDSIRKATGGSLNSCGYDLSAPCDDNGHGTHTMGTMVGDDGKGNQIGMAPGAKWIGCRNMDGGIGTPASYIECFEFFLAPYPRKGNSFTDGDPSKAPHVINNSWGCPSTEGCKGDEFVPALKALGAAGVLVVVSAGNDGPGCGSIRDAPAGNSQYVLSVGAHSHFANRIAGFSSRGPSILDGIIGPQVTAPGVNIRSSVPRNSYSSAYSGTSMAGPHVVGMVALLWQGRPELKGKIEATAKAIALSASAMTSDQVCAKVPGNQIPNNTYGYGKINIAKALDIN